MPWSILAPAWPIRICYDHCWSKHSYGASALSNQIKSGQSQHTESWATSKKIWQAEGWEHPLKVLFFGAWTFVLALLFNIILSLEFFWFLSSSHFVCSQHAACWKMAYEMQMRSLKILTKSCKSFLGFMKHTKEPSSTFLDAWFNDAIKHCWWRLLASVFHSCHWKTGL